MGDAAKIEDIVKAIVSFQEELKRPVERRLFAYFVANAGKWRTDIEIATAIDQSYSSIRERIRRLNLKVELTLGWQIISRHGFGHMIDHGVDLNQDPSVLKRGELVLSPDCRRVCLSGKEVQISYKEYSFLLSLMNKEERFWRMGRLVKDFFPKERDGVEAVKSLVREIRAWLEDDPNEPKRLVGASQEGEEGYMLKR